MRADYAGMTDEELIDRLRDGETDVTDHLMEKYKNLVRSKAKAMFILGADSEDLIQEGMIGLYKAVRDYDSGRDASFYTFAQLCIARQMYTAVQASGRKKHAPLNYYISLYAEEDEAGGGDKAFPLMEHLASGAAWGADPEAMVIETEDAEHLEQAIDNALSPFEKQVMELCMTGMGYAEIARVLGREEKAADNAIQRIRAKLRRIMQKEKD